MTKIASPTFASFLSMFPVKEHEEIRRFARVELYMVDVSDEYKLTPSEATCLGLERWFKSELISLPAVCVSDLIHRLEDPLKQHFAAIEASEEDTVKGFSILIADGEFVAWTGLGEKYYLPAKGLYDNPATSPVSTLTIYVDMLLHRILCGCKIASEAQKRQEMTDVTLNPESKHAKNAS